MSSHLHLVFYLGIFIFLVVLPNLIIADCRVPVAPPGTKLRVSSWLSQKSRRIAEFESVIFYCRDGYERNSGDEDAICNKGRLRVPNSSKEAKPLICRRKPCQVPVIENGKYRRLFSQILFECNRGFAVNGLYLMNCTFDENWNFVLVGEPPTCDPQPECPVPDIPRGHFEGECCYEGDVVKATCPENYQTRSEFLECLSSGSWNDTVPECKYVPSCKDPGQSLHGTRSGSCCAVGSKLQYRCSDGFELENGAEINEIVCLTTEKWNKPRPKCKPKGSVSCELPNLEEHHLFITSQNIPTTDTELEVYLSDSEIELECDKFYENEDSMYLWCDKGAWDNKVPVCHPKGPCQRPLEPKNGKIEEFETDKREEFPIGYEVNFVCDEGYRIKRGEYGSMCLGNNQWEGGKFPDCTKITCGNPGRPENGNREGDSFTFGDEVRFTCFGGYKLIGSEVRKCQENGQWNGNLAICDKGDTYCPNPGAPINGYRTGDGFNLGDEVTFSCMKDFYLLGNQSRSCLEDHTWSGEEVLCRGTQEYTSHQEAKNIFEETAAIAARLTSSSPMMSSLGRALIDFGSTDGVNLIFIFDGSGSIKNQSFTRAKLFAEALIRKVGVSDSPGGTKVAAILFSSQAETIFQASEIRTMNEALQRIKDMEPSKKGTNIYQALHKAAEASGLARVSRPNSKSVAFLLTDGQSNEGGNPEEMAKKLIENHGVELFCITIGNSPNLTLVHRIVTDNENIIQLSNYKELFEVIDYIVDDNANYSRCGLGRSSYTPVIAGLGRVIGGRKVERSWPWVVSLRFKPPNKNEIHKCGGSIIHNEWVLTAAHCFKNQAYDMSDKGDQYMDKNNWFIRAGMIEERRGEEIVFSHSVNVKVADIILHPNYTTESYNFDIALIKLRGKLYYDVFMRPICLPPRFEDLPENIDLYSPKQKAIVVGWGYDKKVEVDDNVQMTPVTHPNEVGLPLQSKQTCGESVKWEECPLPANCIEREEKVTDNMICAGNAKGKQDTCQGDSGGPLMQNSWAKSGNWTEERWFEVGLVSWGVGCAVTGYYGYYTNIAKMRDWIEETTKANFENINPVQNPVPEN